MTLELTAYKCLPCEAERFKINGLPATKFEWGVQNSNLHNKKSKDSDVRKYGCEDSQFVIDTCNKKELMKKYDITEDEYNEVCDKLVKTFKVGECGWCI